MPAPHQAAIPRVFVVVIVHAEIERLVHGDEQAELNGAALKAGDAIALDGNLGVVYLGHHITDKMVVKKGYNY